MKFRFFSMMAVAAGMLFSSCIKESQDLVGTDENVQVSFNINLEGAVQTRAISDGSGVNKLIYSVYDEEGNILDVTDDPETENVVEKQGVYEGELLNGNVKIDCRLVKGHTYQVVFWAQNKECKAFKFNPDKLEEISVTYGANNSDLYDAFAGYAKVKVEGEDNVTVKLKRPFAQINLGTTEADLKAAKVANLEVKASAVRLMGVADKIDLLTGKVWGDADVTLSAGVIPSLSEPKEVLTVKKGDANAEYVYLSMSYVLAGNIAPAASSTAALQGVEFLFYSDKEATDPNFTLKNGLANLPVQANWRTNIVGDIFTSDCDFDIVFVSDWSNEVSVLADGLIYDKKEDTYYISTANGLRWANENLFTTSGNKYKLTANIDMASAETKAASGYVSNIPATEGFEFIFDGAENKISNWTTTGAALFVAENKGAVTIQNLTLENCQVNRTPASEDGAAALLIASDSGKETIIENCKITGSSVSGANYAAALIGYCTSAVQISNCEITTSITGSGYAGSVFGQLGGEKRIELTVERVAVKGCEISGGEGKSGLFAGHIKNAKVTFTEPVYSENTVNGAASRTPYGSTSSGSDITGLPKKVSVMGDSYSTFSGYIPTGYDTYYPRPAVGVTAVEQTWWYQFCDGVNYVLEKNDSWSGSTISRMGYNGPDTGGPFISEARLGNLGNPDVILIFGGTNDAWNSRTNAGEFKYSDWTKDDLLTYRPALAYLLSELQRRYPSADVYFMLNTGLEKGGRSVQNSCVHDDSQTICDYYNVPLIRLKDIEKKDSGGDHPTPTGMTSICNQLKAFFAKN